jgi:intein/homing endonuclease
MFNFSETKKNKIDIGNFDPSREVDKLIDNSFDPSILSEIDESDMPRPKNVLDWLTGKKFLNLGNTRNGAVGNGPYAKQIQIELQLHEQFCPDCTDPALQEQVGILNLPKDISIANTIDRVQCFEYGKCPKCGKTQLDFMHEGIFHAPYELALCLGQRSGKCVKRDSIILSENGMYRIDEFKKGILGFTPFVENIWNGSEMELTSHFYEEKEDKVRSIYTKHGYISGGTYNHPIKVIDDNGDIVFRTHGDIKIGDSVLIKYGQNIWSSTIPTFCGFNDVWNAFIKDSNYKVRAGFDPNVPKEMTKDFARLLGYYVSEGCVMKSGISICNTDNDILDDIENISVSLFGRKYVKRNEKSIMLYGKKILKFFEFIGADLFKSSYKQVPVCIRMSPKIFVLGFLRSLYEGDGCVIKGDRNVSYSTISFRLFRELQSILLNLGILTDTRTRNTWATNGGANQKHDTTGYELSIKGKFLDIFKNEIGFISDRKNTELKNACEWYKNDVTKDCVYFFDHYPDSVKKRFFDAYYKIDTYFKNNVHKRYVECSRNGMAYQKCLKACKGTIFTYGFKSEKMKRIKQIGLTSHHIKWFIQEIENSEYSGLIDFLKEDLDYLKFLTTNCFIDTVKEIKETFEKTYDFTLPKTHQFWSGGFINHNSATIAMDTTYSLEEFVMLPNPQKFFGLLPGAPLVHTFTASSMGQAEKTLWQQFKPYYDLSPWFKEYHKLLDYYGEKLGIPLYHNKATFYLYSHKGLTGYCESPSTRGLRGQTRWRAAIDEIGWFDANIDSTKTKISAEGIYAALNNSLETLKAAADNLRAQGIYNVPQAVMCNISSPSDVNDKIMRQVKAAQKNKRICASHMATWEFNPRQTYEGIRAEYSNDLVFWRDYGAQPPWSSSPYFTDIDQLESLCNPNNIQSTLTIIPKNNQKNTWIEVKAHPKTIIPRILTVDAGENYNSFTLTLSHWNKEKNMPVFDALIEVEPMGKEIDFEYMFNEAILPICEKAHVVQVAFDQWQCLHHIHALKNRNFLAEKYSLNWTDLQNVQGALMSGLIEFPKLELPIKTLKDSSDDLLSVTRGKPVLKLMWQILTVRQIGRKVMKPSIDGLFDDIFRAMSLACAYWFDDKLREDILSRKVSGQQKSSSGSSMCIGSFRGSGGGMAGGANQSDFAVFRPRSH